MSPPALTLDEVGGGGDDEDPATEVEFSLFPRIISRNVIPPPPEPDKLFRELDGLEPPVTADVTWNITA
jgi:hypothetical protein